MHKKKLAEFLHTLLFLRKSSRFLLFYFILFYFIANVQTPLARFVA